MGMPGQWLNLEAVLGMLPLPEQLGSHVGPTSGKDADLGVMLGVIPSRKGGRGLPNKNHGPTLVSKYYNSKPIM